MLLRLKISMSSMPINYLFQVLCVVPLNRNFLHVLHPSLTSIMYGDTSASLHREETSLFIILQTRELNDVLQRRVGR